MQSLGKQLESFFQALLERVDPATAAVLLHSEQARAELLKSRHPIGIGDTAPEFSLADQHGKHVSLRAALADGPVVLMFYRGGWCPYCTITLRAMNKVLPDLRRAGASLLAVSPETRTSAGSTAERNGLRFPLLSDPGNEVARRYGLVWPMDAELRALFLRLGHDLPRINCSTDWELPVPAGYVIDQDGRIADAVVDPRTHVRLEPMAALEAVRRLQTQPAE